MDQKRLKAKLIIERGARSTGTTNRAKGVIQKGNSKGELGGYFGKMNWVSGRGNSPRIVT